jgi:two-component system chemotaxis sensor kinase CheA
MFDQEQWEQLLVSFLEEAKELIQNAETALLALDEQAADEDTINGLFRAMHTLKGSAGLFSLDSFVRFAHQMENLIMRVRDGELSLGEEMVGALLPAIRYRSKRRKLRLTLNGNPRPQIHQPAGISLCALIASCCNTGLIRHHLSVIWVS